MRAVQIVGDEESPKITLNANVPNPRPEQSEILVEVQSAGIIGDEVHWPEVYDSTNHIPGHEISGTVIELGPSYTGPLSTGQDVFAFITADRQGGQCDYVVCKANEVAPKPISLTHAESAAMPISLLTAWEALFDHGDVQPRTTVLITGASGAVGRVLVQIATRMAGANVVALASSRNHGTVASLGATRVLEYADSGWENMIRGQADIVIDTVGGETLHRSWTAVKPTGLVIAVADPAPAWAFESSEPIEAKEHPGVSYKYFIVSPNAERLSRLSEMLDKGTVNPHPVEAYSFSNAEKAWELARQRGRGSKLVINLIDG